jgi:hypothetical protein
MTMARGQPVLRLSAQAYNREGTTRAWRPISVRPCDVHGSHSSHVRQGITRQTLLREAAATQNASLDWPGVVGREGLTERGRSRLSRTSGPHHAATHAS